MFPPFTRVIVQNPSELAAAQAAQARGAAEQARQSARDAAEQARDIARAQRDAAQAERDAAQARRDAEQANGNGDNVGTVTITLENGKTITLDGASPEAVATALGIPQRSDRQESDGPFVVAGIGIMGSVLVLIVGLSLRYRAKVRGVAAPAALPADLSQRLARMEAGIESVAVEVERISEGQRFTTRLLSERAPLEVPRG